MSQSTVNAVVAGWNGGALEDLGDFVDANYVRRGPALLNSDANNLTGLKQLMTNFRTTYPDGEVTIDEIFFQDDRSFSRWTVEGTNTGLGDFPPTGKAIKISGVSFSRYKDGKLIEELVYWDGLDMMVQLGLIELPSAAE